MIMELLQHGRENATSRLDIMNALDISNDRKFYSILADERRQGAVILSGCGYYLPSEDGEQARQEMIAFNRTQTKRGVANLANTRGTKRALEQIPNQLELDLETRQNE